MAFCTLGPIWSRNTRLARWGRSTPFPHAHRENRPIFQNKGFPLNPRWIMCRWTLQDHWGPPEHPRDTSHTFSTSCLRLQICRMSVGAYRRVLRRTRPHPSRARLALDLAFTTSTKTRVFQLEDGQKTSQRRAQLALSLPDSGLTYKLA